MPHRTEWYLDREVILGYFQGTTTLEEIADVVPEYIEMLEAGKAPTHIIIDIRQVEDFPKDIVPLRNILKALRHPNVGWILIVTDSSPAKKLFSSLITQLIYPDVCFRFFNTIEEAADFLPTHPYTNAEEGERHS